MKIPPFDIIITVSTMNALRGSLDFGLQQVKVYADDEKAILPFNYAELETRAADYDTESEDLTSNSDCDNDEAHLVVAPADVSEARST